MQSIMNRDVYQIKDGIYHIGDSFGVYVSLIVGKEKALLIDTGFGISGIGNTVAAITGLPVVVVNTHGHLDHVLGNGQFETAFIHPADMKLARFSSSAPVRLFIFAQARKTVSADERKLLLRRRRYAHNTVPVGDGHIFDLGGKRIRVIHTPGHTAGCISLLDVEDRILFAGDTISSHVFMFLKESERMGVYIESLEKIKREAIHFDSIVNSHGSVPYDNAIIDRLIACAESIDPAQSIDYTSSLAGKGKMYCSGLEAAARELGVAGCENTQAFVMHLLQTPNITKTGFVSIVYDPGKLRRSSRL